MTDQQKQELRKSRVRVSVTYAATLFLFGGAFVLMLVKPDEATDIFFTVLPVASGIISYWFATRGGGGSGVQNGAGGAINSVEAETQRNGPEPGKGDDE